ncbi:hypothetical protein R3P38DRAFT_3311589 [Favolaschia claudopus]|uniref:Uncharacterized protein n=1 Tax=Favolaschia claudopus TaxID=2862362 RepID=A0AAW0CI47_9AGAR
MSAAYQILPNDADASEDGEKYPSSRSIRSCTSYRVVLVLIGIIRIQALALVVLLSRPTRSHPDRRPPLVYSPVQHLVEEKHKVYRLGFGKDLSPFQVPSSPALDKSWEDLYNFGISRIPKNEAAKLPNKTSPIPGDPGYYIAELDTQCFMSCIALDPEYYPEWIHIKRVERSREHVSHCSIMCHVDTSVIVFVPFSSLPPSLPLPSFLHLTNRDLILKKPIWEWGRENAMRVDYDDTVRIEDGLAEPPILP